VILAPLAASNLARSCCALPPDIVNPPPAKTAPLPTATARTEPPSWGANPVSTAPVVRLTRASRPCVTPPIVVKSPPTYRWLPSLARLRTMALVLACHELSSAPVPRSNAARSVRVVDAPPCTTALLKLPPT
jgi:hypothetical protein